MLILTSAATASISLSTICVTEPPLNLCSQEYRWRLNSTIAYPSQPAPEWVTPPVATLVLYTIASAKNNTLQPDSFEYTPLRYYLIASRFQKERRTPQEQLGTMPAIHPPHRTSPQAGMEETILHRKS